MSTISRTLVSAAIVTILAGPAFADEAAEKKTQEKPAAEEAASPILQATKDARGKAGDESLTFDNDALERLIENLPPDKRDVGVYQARPAKTAPQTRPAEGEEASKATGPVDAAKWLAERRAREAEQAKQVELAQKAVADLEARVAELEKRGLALRNPLLPRPSKPEAQEGETDDWDQLDNRARVDRTDDDLTQARAELERARAELDRLRR